MMSQQQVMNIAYLAQQLAAQQRVLLNPTNKENTAPAANMAGMSADNTETDQDAADISKLMFNQPNIANMPALPKVLPKKKKEKPVNGYKCDEYLEFVAMQTMAAGVISAGHGEMSAAKERVAQAVIDRFPNYMHKSGDSLWNKVKGEMANEKTRQARLRAMTGTDNEDPQSAYEKLLADLQELQDVKDEEVKKKKADRAVEQVKVDALNLAGAEGTQAAMGNLNSTPVKREQDRKQRKRRKDADDAEYDSEQSTPTPKRGRTAKMLSPMFDQNKQLIAMMAANEARVAAQEQRYEQSRELELQIARDSLELKKSMFEHQAKSEASSAQLPTLLVSMLDKYLDKK